MEKAEIEFWGDFAQILDHLGKPLFTGVPSGMPDPAADRAAFWNSVRREEMEGRDRLSGMIRRILAGEAPPPMSERDQLVFRYRLEWAMEFAKDRMRKNLPRPTLRECLLAALVVSWEEQGCLEFWRTDGID